MLSIFAYKLVVYCFKGAGIAQPVKRAKAVASNLLGTTMKSREKYVCGPYYK
jgi:hypothetical protein